MRVGFVGAGRMGAPMVKRLTGAGHEVVDLLGDAVVVAHGRLAGRDRRLGQALVGDRRVGAVEQ